MDKLVVVSAMSGTITHDEKRTCKSSMTTMAHANTAQRTTSEDMSATHFLVNGLSQGVLCVVFLLAMEFKIAVSYSHSHNL